MDNATTMATPHPLMTLDKQNMAKTSQGEYFEGDSSH
jgi:hypothetical protein